MANKNKGNNNSEAAKQAKHNKQQFDDVKDFSSFKTVLFYCSLIVFLPVVTFFCLKAAVLDRLFVLTETKSNIYSAVGAVLSLHFALALYIYRAYFGSSTQRQKAD
ncbi:vacuolar ATPase assembly integral membrane protein VMA21 homolog [Calliphora vicina]|uniref:vacuolar ATPase assembly integral membrane protein VMA21 homolog n=1 Tax=Calliphora vicina TaxID=7373 RepID=UPI00325ACC7B